MNEVVSAISNALMLASKHPLGSTSLWGTAFVLDLVKLALCPGKILFVLSEEARIVDKFFITGNGEVVEANINTNRFLTLR